MDRSARTLAVEWSDGVRASYPWSLLRAHCPSAGEVVAREQEHSDPLAIMKKVPSDELVSVKLVGGYALGLRWADGHDAGIYTWPYLRGLTPTEQE